MCPFGFKHAHNLAYIGKHIQIILNLRLKPVSAQRTTDHFHHALLTRAEFELDLSASGFRCAVTLARLHGRLRSPDIVALR